jgi:hypothetical protein
MYKKKFLEIPNGVSNDFELWQPTKCAGIHKRNKDSQPRPGAHMDR